MSLNINSNGFALPTTLIVSIMMMMMMLLAALTSISSISASIKSQYSAKLLSEASESGFAVAQNCHVLGYDWTQPLTPATDCNGVRKTTCPATNTNSGCNFVLNSPSNRSTFSVSPPANVSGTNYRFNVLASVQSMRTSDRTTTNPSVVNTSNEQKYQFISYTSIPPIESGNFTTCAVSNSQLYCWGYNAYGQIGDGTTTAATSPTLIKGELEGKYVYDVATGYYHTCAIAGSTRTPTVGDGGVYCWGTNNYGQFGDATVPINTRLTTPKKTVDISHFGSTWAFTNIAGRDNTCVTIDKVPASKTAGDNAAFCWGRNDIGQAGDNANGTGCIDNAACHQDPKPLPSVSYPMKSSAGNAFTSIDSLKSEAYRTGCLINTYGAGDLYCWGTNALKQLGGVTTVNPTSRGYNITPMSEPVSVHTNRNSVCAINGYATTARAIWCWGNNGSPSDYRNDNVNDTNGLDPLNMARNSGTITPIPAIKENTATNYITTLAMGDNSTCFVKSTGKVYCWGYNEHGQLGQGTSDGPPFVGNNTPTVTGSGASTRPLTPQYAVPVKLPAGVKIVQIAAAEETYCAMSDRATTYCWGANNNGEVGIGTTSTDKTCRCEASPVKINLPVKKLFY